MVSTRDDKALGCRMRGTESGAHRAVLAAGMLTRAPQSVYRLYVARLVARSDPGQSG